MFIEFFDKKSRLNIGIFDFWTILIILLGFFWRRSIKIFPIRHSFFENDIFKHRLTVVK